MRLPIITYPWSVFWVYDVVMKCVVYERTAQARNGCVNGDVMKEIHNHLKRDVLKR